MPHLITEIKGKVLETSSIKDWPMDRCSMLTQWWAYMYTYYAYPYCSFATLFFVYRHHPGPRRGRGHSAQHCPAASDCLHQTVHTCTCNNNNIFHHLCDYLYYIYLNMNMSRYCPKTICFAQSVCLQWVVLTSWRVIHPSMLSPSSTLLKISSRFCRVEMVQLRNSTYQN